MKNVFVVMAMSLATVLVGCGQESTSGGPGAATTQEQQERPNLLGQSDDTFSLDMYSATVRQGETEEWEIAINRGQNFSEDVNLVFAGLPAGVSVSPASPSILQSASELSVMLTAAPNAALGDFTVTVTGQPARGANAVAEVEITVNEADPEKAAASVQDTFDDERDAYADSMRQRWEQFEEQVDALQERADNAQGEAKAAVDAKVASAQVWIDTAAERINELQDAAAENVEAAKAALNDAFAELQRALD